MQPEPTDGTPTDGTPTDGNPTAQSRAYNLLVRRNPAIRTAAVAAAAAVAASLVLSSSASARSSTNGVTAATTASGHLGGGRQLSTVALGAAHASATPTATPSAAPTTVPTTAPTTAAPAVTTPAPAPTTAPPVPSFEAAIAAIVEPNVAHGAVAVTDLSTGASASYDDGGHLFDTASIVKVDILATLLYQHQQAGTTMTADEQAYAVKMIENSDNDAANALFDIDGDVAGLTAANQVFGLTGTTVQDHWGDTTTDPTEQIKLLKQVFTSDSALTAASREYIQGLMSQVESDQRWGVSAAASPGTSYLVKNGWLPNSDTNLWTINSIGEVTYDGHLLLIAVQTDGNNDMDTGVAFAQTIAAAAAKSLIANGG